MAPARMDLNDWFKTCKTAAIGQEVLLQDIILNFIQNRSNINGFHGIVLDGVTGSGKSFLGRALKDTCPFEAVYENCVEIFIDSKIGGPERTLQTILSLKSSAPKLIILDNSENIFTFKDSSASEVSRFSVNPMELERKMFLLAKHLIDKIDREATAPVFLVAIVPDRNFLPTEIRRPGRLNHCFNVNISRSEQREALLSSFLQSWTFETENSKGDCIKILANQPTSGFTPADLESFLQTTWELKQEKAFCLDDFLKARYFVNPSSIVARLTELQPSKVEIVGLDAQLATIQQYMSAIFRNDRTVPLPRGILLEGPSGCGKSLMASKLSSIPFKIGSADASFPVNFISIDSTQIISKYFGQSDRNLSQIFKEARQAAPCILFFDQIDTLVGRRSSSGSTNSDSADRLVTTFLVEMDGLKSKLDSASTEESKPVIVLSTTSRKHLIDPAILRPGRLDLHVNIPLPDSASRSAFIDKFMSRAPGKYQLTPENIEMLIQTTEACSFADLEALFTEAALSALREDIDCPAVQFKHFHFK